MDYKDYYGILVVPPNSEKKVIQKTFHRLARKFHLDLNPENNETEEKIKIVNETYQVLSDSEKHKKYDGVRDQFQQWLQAIGHQQDYDWRNWSPRPYEDVHAQYGNLEDMVDLFGSEVSSSDFLNYIYGQACRSGKGKVRGTPSNPHRGRDIEFIGDLYLSVTVLSCDTLDREGVDLRVCVPVDIFTATAGGETRVPSKVSCFNPH